MKKIPLLILFILILTILVWLGMSTDVKAYDVNAETENVLNYITNSANFRTQLTNLNITIEDLPFYALYNDGSNFYYVFSEFPIVTNGSYFFYTGYKVEGLLYNNNSVFANGNYNTDYQTPNYRLGNFNNNNYTFDFIKQTVKINYTMYGYSNNAVNDTVYISQNMSQPAVLTNIAITNLPLKLDYYIGDSLNIDGLEVIAVYDNNTTEIITSTDYSCSPTVFDTTGNILITVSYLDETATFYVNVYENQSSNILDKIRNFFINFWDNLLHFFVPTDTQINSIRQYYNEQIVGLFGVNVWSYDAGEYDYNYDTFTPVEPPKIDINILGNVYVFDTQDVVDFLDTPVTFGRSMTDLQHYENLPTGRTNCQKANKFANYYWYVCLKYSIIQQIF